METLAPPTGREKYFAIFLLKQMSKWCLTKSVGKNDFVVSCLAESARILLKVLKICLECTCHHLTFKLSIILWLLIAPKIKSKVFHMGYQLLDHLALVLHAPYGPAVIFSCLSLILRICCSSNLNTTDSFLDSFYLSFRSFRSPFGHHFLADNPTPHTVRRPVGLSV